MKLDLIRRSHFPYENALAHLNKHSFNQQKKKTKNWKIIFLFLPKKNNILHIVISGCCTYGNDYSWSIERKVLYNLSAIDAASDA